MATDTQRELQRVAAARVLQTTSRIDLYVAPNAAAASDLNVGTSPSLPLATLDAAFDIVGQYSFVRHPIVVHLASGTYNWDLDLAFAFLAAPVVIIGDGAGQEGDDGFVELLTGKWVGWYTGNVMIDSVLTRPVAA